MIIQLPTHTIYRKSSLKKEAKVEIQPRKKSALKTLNFSLIDQRNDYYEVSGILSLTKEYRRRSTPYNFDHARHPNSDGIEYIYINYHQDSFSGNWELILNYNKVTYDF